MCSCDGPIAQIWQQKTVRSRKDRSCQECGALIPKGARHESGSALAEHEWYHWRHCLQCEELRLRLLKTNEVCAGIYDELYERGLVDIDRGVRRSLVDWITVQDNRYQVKKTEVFNENGC
jgi:hypothetical protein